MYTHVRTHEQVVELWNHRPGDGSVYYAYRPPWVRRKKLEAFYCLHPEKRRYRTQISDDGEVTQDFDTHDGGDNSNDNNDRSALGGGDMGNKGYDHDE